MKNLRLSLPLVDGSLFPMEFATGKELIQELVSNDWGPPPKCLRIEARAKDGTLVTISIPYSDSDEADVTVGEETS